MTKISHQINKKAARMQIIVFMELLLNKRSEFDGLEETYHMIRRDWMKLTNVHLPSHYCNYKSLYKRALLSEYRKVTIVVND